MVVFSKKLKPRLPKWKAQELRAGNRPITHTPRDGPVKEDTSPLPFKKITGGKLAMDGRPPPARGIYLDEGRDKRNRYYDSVPIPRGELHRHGILN